MSLRAGCVAGTAAVLVVVSGLVAPAFAASKGHEVAVIVVPRFAPSTYADRGAVGWLVPGAGSTVTRDGALSSLVHGRVVSSLLGGHTTGSPLIALSRQPAEITVYVALPPAGSTRNVTRYPIAVVGGGYHGLLRSRSTRIDGLVAIADVAPSVVALQQGHTPRIRSRGSTDAPAALGRLDARLRHAHARPQAGSSLDTVVIRDAMTAGRATPLRRSGPGPRRQYFFN